MTGVDARRSLATDAARDAGIIGTPPEGLGVEAFETVGVESLVGVEDTAAIGVGAGIRGFRAPASAMALLVPTICVNSFLNLSRSFRALGETNVKLWPFSSVKSAIFSLTCGAPSLLQNNASSQL